MASASQAGRKTKNHEGPTPGAPVLSAERLAAISGPPSRSSKASHLARRSEAKHRWPMTEMAAGATSHKAWRTPYEMSRLFIICTMVAEERRAVSFAVC
eukprot:scaffold232314_cov32-Tisochrysis_lutea.AAC.6